MFRDSAILPVPVADCAAFLLQKQELAPMIVFSGIFLAANRTAQNSATQADLRGSAFAAKWFKWWHSFLFWCNCVPTVWHFKSENRKSR
jgi:hypothetical protein